VKRLLPVIVIAAPVVGAVVLWNARTPVRNGSSGAPVPDITGRPLRDAYTTLTAAGLRIGALQAVRSDVDTGTVLGQGVAPGTTVEDGTTIPVIVSAGAHPYPRGSDRLVGVGGTCDITTLKPGQTEPCVGGPLVVPLTASG
jgi:beta-lactam-binding protein with PASTA domain